MALTDGDELAGLRDRGGHAGPHDSGSTHAAGRSWGRAKCAALGTLRPELIAFRPRCAPKAPARGSTSRSRSPNPLTRSGRPQGGGNLLAVLAHDLRRLESNPCLAGVRFLQGVHVELIDEDLPQAPELAFGVGINGHFVIGAVGWVEHERSIVTVVV